MEIIENYIGEIIIGVGISFVLGVVAMIRAFFSGINRMEDKLAELETRLEMNSMNDADLKKWIHKIIENKMR